MEYGSTGCSMICKQIITVCSMYVAMYMLTNNYWVNKQLWVYSMVCKQTITGCM